MAHEHPQRVPATVAVIAVVALTASIGLTVRLAAQQLAVESGAPSWQHIESDELGSCPSGGETRDVGSTYWALDGDRLHLRMCMAAVPGWQQKAGSWTAARYKWRISTDDRSFLLFLEDIDLANAGTGGDGRGELTLIDDRDGDGRFSDDWATTWPPEYVGNGPRSPYWQRVESSRSGFPQAAGGRTIGFELHSAGCGPVVDISIPLVALGKPGAPCVTWATDDEDRNLDVMPSCDRGGGAQCLPLSEPASPTAHPTATDRPSSTPQPSATQQPTVVPTDPPATATARPSATDVPASPTPSSTATQPAPTATLRPIVSSPTPTPTSPPADASPTPSATKVLPNVPSATPTPSATKLPSIEPTESASATVTATMTATGAPGATGTATIPPSATAAMDPTATATVTPGVNVPTSTPSPSATIVNVASATPTAAPVDPSPTTTAFQGELRVCVLAEIQGQVGPFPDGGTVHAMLLTPWGTPAKPADVLPIDSDGCVHFTGLEPGQYRTWATVPQTWEPVPGSPPSHYLWVPPTPPGPQAVFRFQPCNCGPGGGGVPPMPPGPPTPGPGGPGGPSVPPGPPTPAPTDVYGPSPDRPIVGAWSALPILNDQGSDPVCSTWVEVQNIGDRPAKALMVVWGAPGFCPPQSAGPLKVECSGLLTPGSTWNFLGAQVPGGARSGMVFSASTVQIDGPQGGDIFADALCEVLFQGVVGNANEYRRFYKAYTERGFWNGFDFGAFDCQPLAVEALRRCPGDIRPDVQVTSSYAGVAGEYFGHHDPVYGGFAYFVPSLYAGQGGLNSTIYVQNVGFECTSVELWFKATDDCLRSRICDILTLAPGETHSLDAGGCLGPGWSGSAWVRTSEPVAVAVDHIGNDVLMTYTAVPSELNYVQNGDPLFTSGSAVAYGPLVYSEYQGWDTAVIVQNLSRTTSAKVKVYFQDRSGGIITTLADWVCAGGSQTFFLPVIASLPGNWVGSIRVESQDWFSPGSPTVRGPNVFAVAQLVKYADVMRSTPQEAIAYNLFPEHLAFDWQLGGGSGGTSSGVGRIGIPSFIKDRRGTGVTSEIAIANIVPKPGFTNFAVFIYDQNGLIDYLCETLSQKQVEYIDLANWGFIHPGFKGSSIISATYWEHDVFDRQGGFTRNLVGLAAVKVERSGTNLGQPIPGDEAAGNIGFPIPGPFRFLGPSAPQCPGQPGGRLPAPPGQSGPNPTSAPGPGPGPTPPAPPGPPPIP